MSIWVFNKMTRWIKPVATAVLLQGGMAWAASEADTPAAGDLKINVDEVEVIGQRWSLSTAQEIKREKLEIVDSVVADDINKLPDYSIAEALQRITGVQIARDRGESFSTQAGNYAVNSAVNTPGITIRGLPMVETLINGREIFTAGRGRTFNFGDVSSDMVSGIDVYKTSSAEHIEGGLGGLVDLRTRHPFDFAGREVIIKGGLTRGNLADETKPQFSLLASDRGQTGIGEIGALLSLGYQKRAYRENYLTSETTTVSGQSLPAKLSQITNVGDRERIGIDLILQWRPTDRLELYTEVHHAQFKTIEDATVLAIAKSGAASNIVLFPGTNDAASVTWAGANIDTTGQARDTIERNTQVAVGGNWVGDALTLKGDLSHTRSYSMLTFAALNLSGATATGFTHNVSGASASASLASSNLLNLASFTTASAWYSAVPFEGNMTALQFDGEYQLSGRLIDSLSAGVRFAARHADNGEGQLGSFPSVAAANAATAVTANPYSSILGSGYLEGEPSLARSIMALRRTLGIAGGLPTSNPLGIWSIDEDTQSAYFMARLKSTDLPLEGNIGVRVIRTGDALRGFQGASNAVAQPLNIDHSYIDTLPSINLRYELSKGLYLRGAASKTMTRPDFSQMSPSLTLNFVQLKGSAGNPELRPMRADNFDIAVEKYINKTTSIYLTAFKKNVDGFVSSATSAETYGVDTYQVTRPYNTGASRISGFEIGYQQFYDFLPGWLSGLGLQANYTYIDSDVENSSLPLAGLSQNSYNLIGMYEKGPVSVRVAYNWRDKYMTSISSGTPVYMDAYGWLDASVGYRINDKITFSLEGSNLLDTERQTYYGRKTRPQTTWHNDTQISATVTLHF
jgi:TonB-dependent receptor